MVDQKYIKKIKHGGFRSFIKKAVEMGVKVQPFPSKPLILKLSYLDKIVFTYKGRVPLLKNIGNFTTNKNTTKLLLDFKLDTILPKNRILKLRNNLNMSDGGRSVECTKEMSEYLKEICLRAIDTVGLSYGGIDLLTKNITTKKKDYVILEINPNPYYNMHEKPLVEGEGIDVSTKILKHLFPKLK